MLVLLESLMTTAIIMSIVFGALAALFLLVSGMSAALKGRTKHD